ncbi:NAD-dependent epimerase/dehydratase family protein [Candidatus Woesearchaeota archaeon]|nr:NAD-dependent epimerase/dehydratase family protein [Candidatus Woesearchaeota archaeon]
MDITIVGGSGFIGSHLADRLILDGHSVKIIDIAKPYQKDIFYSNTNILDFERLKKEIKGSDVVYHLAAYPDVNNAFSAPLDFMNTNVNGTLNILEAARTNDVKRLIFASSVWVYSAADGENVSEDTEIDPLNANHFYALSKILSEAYIRKYYEFYKQEFTILRYGVTYGARAKPNGLVPNFVKKIINDENITIFGDGKNARSLVFINDLVEGNIAALNKIARNKTYNLDGVKPVNIVDFIKILEKIFNKKINVLHEEARKGDYEGKVVSIEKANEELQWHPRISLENGIKEYIKSLR